MRAVSDAAREQEKDEAYDKEKAASEASSGQSKPFRAVSMLVPDAMKAHPMPYD